MGVLGDQTFTRGVRVARVLREIPSTRPCSSKRLVILPNRCHFRPVWWAVVTSRQGSPFLCSKGYAYPLLAVWRQVPSSFECGFASFIRCETRFKIESHS